ncbi:MAG: cation:proton antiporter [Planctomycetota bacterium]
MLEIPQLIVIALLVLGFGVVSRTFMRGVITAPMVFLGAGLLLAHGVGWLGLSPLGEDGGLRSLVHTLGEATLIVLLFIDAARIDIGGLRREGALPARLLGIGMPLTIVFGALVAWPLFPGFGMWELALVGAVLAPTDAALGQAVVTSDEVPARIRQTLSVESGLNDGIAVPMVVLFASMASIGQVMEGAESSSMTAGACIAFAAKQVTLGPLAGIFIGVLGAKIVSLSIRRGWMNREFQELSGIALAILAAMGAELIGGNAFIAAFVGGLAFGNASTAMSESLYDFAEAEGTLLMLLTFLFAGAALLPDALHAATGETVVYAALSLTIIRMLPVGLCLIGVPASPETKGFLGWFGPRGIASVLFAILLIEELPVPHSDEIFVVTMVTVTLSVVLHGATAAPGARWYARQLEKNTCPTAAKEPGMCYRTRAGSRARTDRGRDPQQELHR